MPVTVSLEVPYADTEQQFLILAVQMAVRTFRSINARPAEQTLSSSSTNPLVSSPPSFDRTKEALTES